MVLEEQIRIAAAPARVWQLVADPERMSAFSPELHHIEWIGDSAARVGGTFRAFNRVGPVRWRTRNVIESADPPRLFAWRAMDGPGYSFVTRRWSTRLDSVPGYRLYDGPVRLGNAVRTVQLRRVVDCPHADQVRELVRRTAAACGVVVELDELVGDYPSPTVLIDGRDVTGRSTEGALCRLDLPTEGQIRTALQRRQPEATAS